MSPRETGEPAPSLNTRQSIPMISCPDELFPQVTSVPLAASNAKPLGSVVEKSPPRATACPQGKGVLAYAPPRSGFS